MSKKNFPAYEPLDDQLRMLKSDIRPDNALKSAVVGAQASTVIIPARVHVKQTAKAILLYAACIALFLGAIMLLPRLFSQQTPVGTQPSVTTTPAVTDRDTIENPEQYSEQRLKELQTAWAAIKPYCPENTTINDYRIWNIFQLRDMVICQYMSKNRGVAEGPPQAITIGDCVFVYDILDSEMYVFADQNRYTIADAYNAGVLSNEDLQSILENHKKMYPNYYIYYLPEPKPTTPYVYDASDPSLDLGKLLENKTCVNNLIDSSSIFANGFTPWYPDKTDVSKLFDGIKTKADYSAAETGILAGSYLGNTLYLFDMKEKVQISAYVIITGSENHLYPDRNPVAWYLFATNDTEAAAAIRRDEREAYIDVTDPDSKWTILDYVYDGYISHESFYANGYVIDAANQGEYQYYCWCVEYTGGNNIEVAELELFVEKESHSTTPEIPANRDTLANPEQYTELELQAIYAIWAAYKETHQEFLTINDILPDDVSIHGDAVVCYDYVGTFPGDALSVDTALGYRFVYPTLQQKRVFANGTVYTFQEAYDAGVLTEEDIRALWEEHKKQYPILNEQYA